MVATDCAASLRELAGGVLRDWRGLGANCDREDAEAAFGPSEQGPDGSAMLGGSLTAFRRYPATDAAPAGVVVWFEADRIIVVEIVQPALPEPIEAQLGSPEATERSGLKAFHTQLVYAGRGLTAHVDDDSRDVFRLYAYAPMTADEFLSSPLSAVESRRIPRRP